MKDTTKINLAPNSGHSPSAASRKEVRCAVRFPLSLQAVLSSDREISTKALTRNVSASGVLLDVHDPLERQPVLDSEALRALAQGALVRPFAHDGEAHA